jgi:hypothetical protein
MTVPRHECAIHVVIAASGKFPNAGSAASSRLMSASAFADIAFGEPVARKAGFDA